MPNIFNKLWKYNKYLIFFFIIHLFSTQHEIRFNSFKIFSDIIVQFLNDELFYDNNITNNVGQKNLKELILKSFIQNLKLILNDSDPMPLYGIKLLNEITKKDLSFVITLKNMKLLNIIMEYFQYNHPKLSVVTLKLISRILECKEITLEELSIYNFFNNVKKNKYYKFYNKFSIILECSHF